MRRRLLLKRPNLLDQLANNSTRQGFTQTTATRAEAVEKIGRKPAVADSNGEVFIAMTAIYCRGMADYRVHRLFSPLRIA